MALHLSRTLAIKAVGLMAVLLIFFNLIGLRLEIKFDRSPLHSMNLNLTTHTARYVDKENDMEDKHVGQMRMGIHNKINLFFLTSFFILRNVFSFFNIYKKF